MKYRFESLNEKNYNKRNSSSYDYVKKVRGLRGIESKGGVIEYIVISKVNEIIL